MFLIVLQAYAWRNYIQSYSENEAFAVTVKMDTEAGSRREIAGNTLKLQIGLNHIKELNFF